MSSTPSSGGNRAGSLLRSLGYWTATSVVIANVIGSGIFTTTGFLARDLETPFAILAIWVVGALLALAGALCYSELAAAHPQAGGEYVYLREAYGPLAGFLTGWGSFIAGFSAPTAAACLSFAVYLSHFFPAASEQNILATIPLGWTTFKLSGAHVIGLVALWSLSLVHASSARHGGAVQVLITTLKTLAMVLLIAAGLSLGHGAWDQVHAAFSPRLTDAAWSNAPVSLVFILFCYSGWNAAAYLAADIERQQRNVPLALLTGTAVVSVLYLGMNTLFLYALPVAEMKGVLAIGEKASAALFGPAGAALAAGFMALSILSSASAMTMAGPRVYYAMACDGAFPPLAARLHPRSQTPAGAIYLQALWASLLLLTGTFEQLIVYSGFVLVFFSTLAVLAVIILRRRQPQLARPFRVPLYPLPPLLFAGFSAWILYFTAKGRPQESLAGVALVLAGVPLYYYWSSRRRTHGKTNESGG